VAVPNDFRALIEAIDEPAILVEQGRVAVANSAARELLGRGIHGSDIRLAIRHPLALEPIVAGIRSDAEIAGIGGADRPWHLSVRPTGDGLLLVRLTDRSVARAAEKMRVDFVANASHELRTPLTTILGYAETIAEDSGLPPEQQARFGGIIRTEAKRMLRIVEDLMSLSRIEADRFVAPRDLVSVEEVARIATEQAEVLASRRHCLVELHVEPNLPKVRGDFAQLLQMLDNLITNALRYGCRETGCTVVVSARADQGAVRLSVADTGEGVAREHLPRLTERFYRIDDARSRDSGGTGLGLAIVKHIVERHRGTLEIKSELGRGTEVMVRIPAA
jgi:two-component system phosphate regulon sensor histidine kinase PhoR